MGSVQGVDLAQVDFIDTTGPAAIVRARDHSVDLVLPFDVSRSRPAS